MNSVSVPITQFATNAQSIFDDVRKSGAKLITSLGKKPCVMLTAEEYVRMTDEMIDRELAQLAAERLSNFDGTTYTEQEVLDRLGITEEEIAAVGDVEIE